MRRKKVDNQYDTGLKKRVDNVSRVLNDLVGAFFEAYPRHILLNMFSEGDDCYQAVKEEYGAYKRKLMNNMEYYNDVIADYNDYFNRHKEDLETTKGIYTSAQYPNAVSLLEQVMLDTVV